MASSRLKKAILGIAIAIVLVFFLGYAVNTMYEPPRYDDYCNNTFREVIENRAECDAAGGRWNAYDSPKLPVEGRFICNRVSEDGDEVTLSCTEEVPEQYNGYCEQDFYCREEFQQVQETHARISFIILVILGLGAIALGGFMLSVEAVGSGIMGGGVLTLIYAAIRFWGNIPDYGRLLVLGIALTVLIWIGYRKLKN